MLEWIQEVYTLPYLQHAMNFTMSLYAFVMVRKHKELKAKVVVARLALDNIGSRCNELLERAKDLEHLAARVRELEYRARLEDDDA